MCILRSQSRLCTGKQRATRDKGGMIGGAVAAADKHPKDKGREGKEEEVEEVTGTEEVVEEECKLKGRESQEEEEEEQEEQEEAAVVVETEARRTTTEGLKDKGRGKNLDAGLALMITIARSSL